MYKEDKYKMVSLIADMDTGEITSKVTKVYDFRFHSERQFLHSLLDKFIEKVRNGNDNITFEIQYGKKAFEYKIPF